MNQHLERLAKPKQGCQAAAHPCESGGSLRLLRRCAQVYWQWHSKSSPVVYNNVAAPFRDRNVVGILWGGKIDYATWFGLEVGNSPRCLRL